MTKTLVEELRTSTDPEWFRALMITAASRIEELERALGLWQDLAARDRINMVDKNKLDEIVLTGMAHLEQMNSGSWYLGLYRPDGTGYQVWLSAKKGPMIVYYETIEARQALTEPSPATPVKQIGAARYLEG